MACSPESSQFVESISLGSNFIRDITSLGDKKRILAHKDIHSSSGVKLLVAGGGINSRTFEKLVAHKLQSPIETCLTIEDAVTPAFLLDAIIALITPNSNTVRNVDLIRPETFEKLKQTITNLPLSETLAFRLTVMRDTRHGLFQHSIQVAGVAFVMRNLISSDPRGLMEAFAAGLCHDIGMMHVNPDLLNSNAQLAEDAHKFIHSHPIIGSLILQSEPVWGSGVARAVLEHHERLDASGYPRGISGAQISELGQLIAIAELMTTMMFADGGIKAPLDISVILRFCNHKFNHQYVGASHFMLSKVPSAPSLTPPIDKTVFIQKMQPLIDCLIMGSGQGMVNSEEHNNTFDPLKKFINEQSHSLARSLSSVGIDINDWSNIAKILDLNEQCLVELNVIRRELLYQLRALVHEFNRRWGLLQITCIELPPQLKEWAEVSRIAVDA